MLNKFRWNEENLLPSVTLIVSDRASATGEKTIAGSDIKKVTRTWLETLDGTMIPLYKVQKVMKGETVIWERPGPTFVSGKLVCRD